MIECRIIGKMVIISLDETPRSPALTRKYRDKMMQNAEEIFGDWDTIRDFREGAICNRRVLWNALTFADICPEFLNKCLESAFCESHYNAAYRNPAMTLEIAKKYAHMVHSDYIAYFCGNGGNAREKAHRLRELADEIDWDRAHLCCELPESIIIERWLGINFPMLCSMHYLREDFIRNACIPRLICEDLPKLTRAYRKKCIESICAHQQLSQQFLLDFADHIIWVIALACQKTDDEFFMKHRNRYELISRYSYYSIYDSHIKERMDGIYKRNRSMFRTKTKKIGRVSPRLPNHLVRVPYRKPTWKRLH